MLPRELQVIQDSVFANCKRLRQISFGEHCQIESIWSSAFRGSGLESFTGPASLLNIEVATFKDCRHLRSVDLSACRLQNKHYFGKGLGLAKVFEHCELESIAFPPTLRVVEEREFEGFRSIRSVTFGADSELEEIGQRAFYGCALESFAAPPRLKRIGPLAFGACRRLADVRLGAGIQELGLLCFWNTALAGVELPPNVPTIPEVLGVGQREAGVVHVPVGVQTMDENMFSESDVEKVVLPSSVKALCKKQFYRCPRLREVVFEPRSRLESIGYGCFKMCGLRAIVIPKSVRTIGDNAFDGCMELTSFRFEPWSQLASVGRGAFFGTPIKRDNVRYPDTFKSDGSEFVL